MNYAHSRQGQSRDTWQDLEAHLKNVSALAESFAPHGLKAAARLAGLWHDIGKYQAAFQRYIADDAESSNGVPHAGAGAALALDRLGLTPIGCAVAAAIEAHHGALKSPGELLSAIDERGRKLLRDSQAGGLPPALEAEQDESSSVRSALSVRMLFSAIVDADLLDTEAWDRGSPRVTSLATMEKLRDLLDNACVTLNAHTTAMATSEKERALAGMRYNVYQSCVQRAVEDPGHFTLTVPTGGGKTLSGLAFALHHAVRHGKRRIIIVAPYTSILEQTADVYRRILGTDGVVEHHSNLEPALDTDRNRQACENWDASIIVTTSVQLFESLHSAHKRPCRKLHRIADSIILLDEVQTFPMGLLQPIHAVLAELVRSFGVTVVHGTATQPLMARPSTGGSGKTPEVFQIPKTEIMDEPASLFHVVRERFRLEPLGNLAEPLDPALLVADVHQQHSALVITHRRDDARHIAESLGEDCLHLSAAMCAAHRSDVLRETRCRLAENLPCIVVATQLVEAGIDLDFPVVYRALAGLETLAQAAGRCNRGMKLSHPGRFVVYRAGTPGMDDAPLKESKPPQGTPKLSMEIAWNEYFQHGMPDLSDHSLFPAYTAKVLNLRNTDEKAILDSEQKWNFPQVAKDFRMIDEPKISVLAPYGDCLGYVERLRSKKEGPFRDDFRALQRYAVGVSDSAFREMFASGWVEPVLKAAETPLDTLWYARPGSGSPYHERFGFAGRGSEVKLRLLQV